MDDLTICKRIAEIEGLEYINGKYTEGQRIALKTNYYNDKEYPEFYRNNAIEAEYFKHNKYNPLTDDALCFQLSKKYNVSLMHYEEYSTARIWDDPEDNPIADFSNINNDTSLNKAICLAIIEAHKDND